MDVPNNLSVQQIDHQKSYCKKISTRYEDYSEEALQFVFSPFFQPEVWEDASKVFKTLLLDYLPLDQKEIPVLFVGGRAQNKITRKNQAVGFLLTDHMIYVREMSVFTDYLPKVYPYPSSKVEAIEVLGKAASAFEWEFFETILSDEVKKELMQLMIEAITDILTTKETLEISHVESLKSNDLSGRITELGLLNNSCVKMGSDEKHSKHFRKVIKKFSIPLDETIELAITDSTLMGPYGLVVTDRSIYSKDLMESPVCTSREEIEANYPVKIIEDSIILGTNIAHMMPNSLNQGEKESVKTILVEYLSGEIALHI
ncbi:hypothetical protein IGI67_001046 [Enterococcus sp. AZ196]